MRRDDDARRSRPFGRPADGAEVARVGDAVEHREQRTLDGGQLIGVGVAVRLDARDHALVVARTGELGQVALLPHPHPRSRRLEPRLGLERPLGRQELEHLATAAQRLANGAAAVHEVGCHVLCGRST